MFWGLILEPERRYSQVVKKPFCITMAALDLITSDNKPTQVIVTFQDRNFLMCTLKKDGILNERLDLRFEEGDQISFAANGNSHVHLTGYLMDVIEEDEAEDEEESEDEATNEYLKKRRADNSDLPPKKKSKTLELLEELQSDSEEDSDFSLSKLPMPASSDEEDSGEEEEDGENESGDEEEDGLDEEEDDDDEDDEDEDEEMDEEDEDEEDEDEEEEIQPKVPVKKPANKKQAQNERKQINDNKKNQDKQQTQNKKQSPKDSKNSSSENEKSKKGEKNAKQSKKDNQKNGSPAKIRTIEGGVNIEDIKVGSGVVAKPGKFVHVYYEGRLKSNNKLFDSATKGPGFEFRLGRQEVIKGWDVGVAGMKVGGKRRIVCPPNMAYGAKGAPPAIPPNSTLVFDVELKKVK